MENRQIAVDENSECIRLLLDLLPQRACRILAVSLTSQQLAPAIARHQPAAHITAFFLDLFHFHRALNTDQPLSNLMNVCDSDLPDESFDAVVMLVSVSGEAELTRDLLQQAHERLEVGGHIIAAVNHQKDRWLHEQIETMFGRLRRSASGQAAAYIAQKREPLRKRKEFVCEFVFRDREKLLRAYSRPGVFSHRRIDPGARQLLNAMQVSAGDRVLDIGCGSGVVGLAAAARAPDVLVHCIDGHARAVQCTRMGAQQNQLPNVTAELALAGQWQAADQFELALANPPYFASFRIAEAFLWTARQSLISGGQVLAVTKLADWYLENMPLWFDDVEIEPSKGYFVFRGTKREH